jgi:hypothetical protein
MCSRRKGGDGKQICRGSSGTVQILFQPPAWPYEQIGIVTSQGAQVASDATVYSELQSQAAKLGADAVLVVSAGMKQYAAFPGVTTYNANGNLYGNNAFVGGRYQATGLAVGPQSYVGLNVQGIALKRISVPLKRQ